MPEQHKINVSQNSNPGFRKAKRIIQEQPVKQPEKQHTGLISNSNAYRANLNSHSISPKDLMQLQSTIGNQAVMKLFRNVGKAGAGPDVEHRAMQKKVNNSGLPEKLKTGVENLSGLAMDDVRVQYNSSKPSDVGALAYTQGSNIMLAPGQERHLPHEVWHVVQQKQGRVSPTIQAKSIGINVDAGLETEADIMGAKALATNSTSAHVTASPMPSSNNGTSDYAASPIQFKLTNAKDFKLKTASISDNIIDKIAPKLDEYNIAETALDLKKSATIELCFQKLEEIDRTIYGWFNNVSDVHETLSEAPLQAVLQELLHETEQEHIALIEKTKTNTDFIPINTTGMSAEEIKKTKTLWQSLVNNSGKLKISGDSKFTNTMLSYLAKIMNTETGRKLLNFLNSGDSTDEMTNVYIASGKQDLPQNVRDNAKSLEENLMSRSQPFGESREDALKDTELKEISDADFKKEYETYVKDNSLDKNTYTQGDYKNEFYVEIKKLEDFRNVVLDKKEKKGIYCNGHIYGFSKGTGAMVTLGAETDNTVLGPKDHEILMPRFVTLAHELGHAAHQKAGATTAGAGYSKLMEKFSEKDKENTRVYWADESEFKGPEEMINTKNFENAVRQESGLTNPREGHISPQGLEKIKLRKLKEERKKELDKIMGPLLEKDNIVQEMIADNLNLYLNSYGKAHIDTEYEEAKKIAKNCETETTDEKIRNYKKAKIEENFEQLQGAYNNMWFWNRYSYSTIFNNIKDKFAKIDNYINPEYVRGGSNSYQLFIKEIRDCLKQFTG